MKGGAGEVLPALWHGVSHGGRSEMQESEPKFHVRLKLMRTCYAINPLVDRALLILSSLYDATS